MDTKNAFGQHPTTLRAAEPLSKLIGVSLSERTVTPGYGGSLAEDRVLRGRSSRPGQHRPAAHPIG